MLSTNVCIRATKSTGPAGSLYFRIRGVGTVFESIQAHVLKEVEFYSTTDATGTNHSLTATKTASHELAGSLAPAAGDGLLNTEWNSNVSGGNTAGAWWRCQFATPIAIRSVVIKPNIGYYTQQYALESSTNGTTWTTVATRSTSGVSGAVQTFLSIQ